MTPYLIYLGPDLTFLGPYLIYLGPYLIYLGPYLAPLSTPLRRPLPRPYRPQSRPLSPPLSQATPHPPSLSTLSLSNLSLCVRFAGKGDLLTMGDKHGNLPIHYAAVRGQVTCVQLFLKEANVPGEMRDGTLPLLGAFACRADGAVLPRSSLFS